MFDYSDIHEIPEFLPYVWMAYNTDKNVEISVILKASLGFLKTSSCFIAVDPHGNLAEWALLYP